MDLKVNDGFIDDDGNSNVIKVKPINNHENINNEPSEENSEKNVSQDLIQEKVNEPNEPIAEKLEQPIKTTVNHSKIGLHVETSEEKSSGSSDDKNENKKSGSVPGYKLFRYAKAIDMLFIFIGTIGAIANGCAVPASMLFFTNIIGVFTDGTNGTNANNVYNRTNFTVPSISGPLRTQAINLTS